MNTEVGNRSKRRVVLKLKSRLHLNSLLVLHVFDLACPALSLHITYQQKKHPYVHMFKYLSLTSACAGPRERAHFGRTFQPFGRRCDSSSAASAHSIRRRAHCREVGVRARARVGVMSDRRCNNRECATFILLWTKTHFWLDLLNRQSATCLATSFSLFFCSVFLTFFFPLFQSFTCSPSVHTSSPQPRPAIRDELARYTCSLRQ